MSDLIAACRDSQEGFSKAAKGCHDRNLRHRFVGIARRRADFADDLAAFVRKSSVEPPAAGHQSGIQHSGWRELEASIQPKDDATFVAECQEGEENTRKQYERALAEDLPPEVRTVVERQRLAVQEALLELRNLEQVRRAG